MKRPALILITLLCLANLSPALPPSQDSLIQPDSLTTYRLSFNPLTNLPQDTLTLPAIPADPHRYEATNLHFDWTVNTGNPGAPAFPLILPATADQGIRLQRDPQAMYYQDLIRPSKYLVQVPYTHLAYTSGAGKEQHLNLTHAQQFTPQWYFSTDFRLISAPGNYQNQRNDLNTLVSKLEYNTRNHRYHAMLAFEHHKYRNRHNGGILNDSLFLSNSESDPGVIPVNLASASSVNRNTGWVLRHRLSLRKSDGNTDAAPAWLPRTLSHMASVSNQYRNYLDSDPGNDIYGAILKDSTTTFDSTGLRLFTNTVSLTNAGTGYAPRLTYIAGVRLDQGRYFDGIEERSLHTLIPFTTWSYILNNKLIISAEAEYHTTGTLQDDYSLAFAVGNDPARDMKMRFHFQAGRSRNSPALTEERFYGNHRQWDDDLPASVRSWLRAEGSAFGFQVTASFAQATKQVFFDAAGQPFLHEKALAAFHLILEKGFKAGLLSTNHKVGWQALDRPDLQRYPRLLASTSLCLDLKPFGEGSTTRLGADLTYLDQWNSYGYFPETDAFTLYPGTTQGHRLFTDIHLTLLLQRAAIFLKYRDLSGLINGQGFFVMADYPMPYRGLLFGVSWIFHD